MGFMLQLLEWLANGTYVMGEAIHNTVIPFENFARVSTWIFFLNYHWLVLLFQELDGERTAGNKIVGAKMALLQLMLLGFAIITLYEVLIQLSQFLMHKLQQELVNGMVPDIDRLVCCISGSRSDHGI